METLLYNTYVYLAFLTLLLYLNVQLQLNWTNIGMKIEQAVNGHTQPLR